MTISKILNLMLAILLSLSSMVGVKGLLLILHLYLIKKINPGIHLMRDRRINIARKKKSKKNLTNKS